MGARNSIRSNLMNKAGLSQMIKDQKHVTAIFMSQDSACVDGVKTNNLLDNT